MDDSLGRLLRARNNLREVSGVASNGSIKRISDAVHEVKRRFSALRNEALDIIYTPEREQKSYPCCIISKAFSMLYRHFAPLYSIVNIVLGLFNTHRGMGMFLSNPFLR